MVDRGIGDPPQNQGGEDARFMAERPFGTFRGVANVDYLSSFVFRLAFTDVYSQAIDSEVRSQIFLSNTTNGFHFDGLAERYQNFAICDPATDPAACTVYITQTELVRILHTPSIFIQGGSGSWGILLFTGRLKARPKACNGARLGSARRRWLGGLISHPRW